VRRILLLALLIVAGGVAGVWWGLRATSRTEPAAPPADAGAASSYYLRALRSGGLEIEAETPMILSPRKHETLSPSAPER